MSRTIAVIGSGGWGTAISTLLARQGYQVNLWSYLKEESEQMAKDKENKAFLPGVMLADSIHYTDQLEQAVKGRFHCYGSAVKGGSSDSRSTCAVRAKRENYCKCLKRIGSG